jgi:hypothetical protein
MSNVILNFFIIQNYLKINHWQTTSYATHVAIGNLYDTLNVLIDQFIETLQGKMPNHITFKNPEKIEITNQSDKDIKKLLSVCVRWIENELPKILLRDEKITMSSDLKNIADEMISQFNKTLFLLTLN